MLIITEFVSDLSICKLSDSTSPVSGQKELLLFCEKVAKGRILFKIKITFYSCLYFFGHFLDDIEIVFQHEEEGRLLWEDKGDFSSTDVHKQVAISFRTPSYNRPVDTNLFSF